MLLLLLRRCSENGNPLAVKCVAAPTLFHRPSRATFAAAEGSRSNSRYTVRVFSRRARELAGVGERARARAAYFREEESRERNLKKKKRTQINGAENVSRRTTLSRPSRIFDRPLAPTRPSARRES